MSKATRDTEVVEKDLSYKKYKYINMLRKTEEMRKGRIRSLGNSMGDKSERWEKLLLR